MSDVDRHIFDVESGHYISENAQRLGEILNDYDSQMKLSWIPPKDRANDETYPFAIMMHEANGSITMVMKLTDAEMRNPQAVLERVFQSDTRKNDVLGMLEASDRARQAWEMKKQMDADDEAREFAMTVLKSPLHTFKHNGRTYQ